jgi:ankyrin repeat protein
MMMSTDVKSQIAIAMRAGNEAEVRRLFTQHPDFIHVETGVGTWLHKAAHCGDLRMVQCCVEIGIDVNAPHPGGCPPETAVFDAVLGGSADVVRWLLEKGAKSNCVVAYEGGVTRNFALGEAIDRGHLDLVQLLVEYGADVNVYYAGHTPLSRAERMGHKQIARYLRSKGAKLPDELGHKNPEKKPDSPQRKRKKA